MKEVVITALVEDQLRTGCWFMGAMDGGYELHMLPVRTLDLDDVLVGRRDSVFACRHRPVAHSEVEGDVGLHGGLLGNESS